MRKKTTIQKQLLAFLFLGVFLLIHVGKAAHSHESAGISKQGIKTEQVSASADCSVCDFHLTKDAEHAVAANSLQQRVPIRIQPTAFQSRKPSSIGLTFSDRGPPALA